MQEYYEDLRKKHEAQMKGQSSDFKSPVVYGFDDYWDYGQEH